RVVCVGPELVEHVEAVRPHLGDVAGLVGLGSAPVPAGWVCLDELMADAPPEPLAGTTSSAGSFMVYTSGTTGRPKGAERVGVGTAEALRLIATFECS